MKNWKKHLRLVKDFDGTQIVWFVEEFRDTHSPSIGLFGPRTVSKRRWLRVGCDPYQSIFAPSFRQPVTFETREEAVSFAGIRKRHPAHPRRNRSMREGKAS